ncbi:MAG: SDR family oxidoreductase [Xanthobacteraceae bacterium]|nr:SDR family oxidoreductase [Xanthobacteraceae bacterium]QYK46706.1 MAG: SDR family oxidoreductase [Xanthobacteraceae bacterium]
MHVLVTGAAGMIGRKLVERLAREPRIGGKPIARMTLIDVEEPAAPKNTQFKTTLRKGDISLPGEASAAIADSPDYIFHLAGVVSGEAETDFEKGYRVNLDGTRFMFDAIRLREYKPRVVFTSSMAVFGGPFDGPVTDDFHLTPHTSYGVAKAIGEQLLADYSRRGFFDGVGIRLPAITVRPGKPNKAASGFFSGIIREPLAGHVAMLPVPEDLLHSHASPRAAVGYLLHAATLDTDLLDLRPNITMPSVACTIAQQIESLRKVGGDKAVARIQRVKDTLIERIVAGWPHTFDAKRALDLGFVPDKDFDEIVAIHVEDELGGKVAA